MTSRAASGSHEAELREIASLLARGYLRRLESSHEQAGGIERLARREALVSVTRGNRTLSTEGSESRQ